MSILVASASLQSNKITISIQISNRNEARTHAHTIISRMNWLHRSKSTKAPQSALTDKLKDTLFYFLPTWTQTLAQDTAATWLNLVTRNVTGYLTKVILRVEGWELNKHMLLCSLLHETNTYISSVKLPIKSLIKLRPNTFKVVIGNCVITRPFK